MFVSDVHVWPFTMAHILPPFSKNKPLLKNNHQLVGGPSLAWQSLLLFCLFFANTAHFLLDEIMIIISNTDGRKLLGRTGNPLEPGPVLKLWRALSVPLPMWRLRASSCCPGPGNVEHWTWLSGILSEGKSGCCSAFSWCWTIPSQHVSKFLFAPIFLWAKEKCRCCPFLYWCLQQNALLSSLLFFPLDFRKTAC